jgi:hypothetical protein
VEFEVEFQWVTLDLATEVMTVQAQVEVRRAQVLVLREMQEILLR